MRIQISVERPEKPWRKFEWFMVRSIYLAQKKNPGGKKEGKLGNAFLTIVFHILALSTSLFHFFSEKLFKFLSSRGIQKKD